MEMSKQPEPRYYTPLEAARILRVDTRTLYGWLRAGTLKAVKFGGSWRIPAESLKQ